MQKMPTVGQKFGRKYGPSGRNSSKAHAPARSMKSQPFVRNDAQNTYRRTEIQPKKTIGSTKCEPFIRTATQNRDRRTEKKL